MSRIESSRLAYVDALRLLAAGLVLFQHIAERNPGPLVHPLVQLGPGVAGVVLFFLISGFVIPFSVRGGLQLRGFMIRRVLRIYPLFLAAVAVVAIGGFTGLLADWTDLRTAPPLRWIANLLLVQDFLGIKAILGVSWTLIIELAWYALFAASLILFKSRAATILAIAAPCGLLALAAVSLAIDTRIPLARPAMIYAAILGYQTYLFTSGQLSGRALALAIAVFLGVTWFTNYVAFGIYAHPRITLEQAIGPWTIAPIMFFVVVLIPAIRNAPLVCAGLLPAIGATSYSIYLLHPIANVVAEQYFAPGLEPLVAVLLTGVLAAAGYHWVEKPGIALGRRLSASRPSNLAAGA